MVRTQCDNCHLRTNQMKVRDGEDRTKQMEVRDGEDRTKQMEMRDSKDIGTGTSG